jgi:predicted transcriptional regulator YdeE
MNPKFEQLGAFSIIGCPQYANPRDLCPGLAWDRLTKLRRQYGLTEFPKLAFAIEVYPPDFPNNDFKFYYMAGMVLDDAPKELRNHLFIKEVPAASYAVFPIEDNNTDNIKAAFEYAYQKWLPSSEYRLSHRFDLERYKENPEICYEIMLPVVNKNESP